MPHTYSVLGVAKRTLLLLVLVCLLAPDGGADDQRDTRRTIKVLGPRTLLLHEHDWSSDKPRQLAAAPTQMLSSANDFSSLVVADPDTGERLFEHPVPALSHLVVVDGGEVLVGLSNIRLYNPYQIVVFDRRGDLLLASHVSAYEACLDSGAMTEFSSKFTSTMSTLAFRMEKVEGVYYIDYRDLADLLEDKPHEFLLERECPSHLSPNIKEVGPNRLHWFDEGTPAVRLAGDDVLIVRDPAGSEIRFRLAGRGGSADDDSSD